MAKIKILMLVSVFSFSNPFAQAQIKTSNSVPSKPTKIMGVTAKKPYTKKPTAPALTKNQKSNLITAKLNMAQGESKDAHCWGGGPGEKSAVSVEECMKKRFPNVKLTAEQEKKIVERTAQDDAVNPKPAPGTEANPGPSKTPLADKASQADLNLAQSQCWGESDQCIEGELALIAVAREKCKGQSKEVFKDYLTALRTSKNVEKLNQVPGMTAQNAECKSK